MSIGLMICFARSGGTLLNQCIGSLPDVIMMSEVNPLGGGSGRGPVHYQTVKDQAKHWYNIEIESDNYSSGIIELGDYCTFKKKHLVVRDWTFINFVPREENKWEPPERLLALEQLENISEVIPFAFIRDSIDIWISRNLPPANEFFRQYLNYVRELVNRDIKTFKYEEFCRYPSYVLREICNFTGLEYSDSYNNYLTFQKVNGDIQIKSKSRGSRHKKISLLPRRLMPLPKILEVNHNNDMKEANSLMNYPISYTKTSQLLNRLRISTIKNKP